MALYFASTHTHTSLLLAAIICDAEHMIVGRPAAIDRRPLVLRHGSAILSATAVVIQWSGSLFSAGSWQCSGIWGRLVTATRTVVRRPVGGWFLRPNGAQNGSKTVSYTHLTLPTMIGV